ncbi:MAG: tetratricopeptide repeat protein, partial [Phycisphaerae bacterium]
MARRKKKLNKKVVGILAVIGLAVIALGGIAVVRLMPKDPVALANEAEQLYRQGEWKDATGKYREAIGAAEKKNRDDLYVDYCLRYTEINTEWLEKEADQLSDPERRKIFSAAVSGLETARRAAPKNEEVLRELADIRWSVGDMDSFMDVSADLVEVAPDDATTHMRRSIAMARKAMITPGRAGDEAIASFDKTIALDPNNADYRLGKASFLRGYGELDEAEATLAKAMEEMPDNQRIPIAYAQFLVARNDLNKAREMFEEAVRRDPDAPRGHIALARYMLSQQQFEDALDSAQKARKADPDDADVYHLFADIYRAQKKFDEAAVAYREAIANVHKEYEGKDELTPTETVRRDRELVSLSQQLANLLLDMAQTGQGEPEKLAAEANAVIEGLDALKEDAPARQKIAGRIAMLKGNIPEAIDLLKQAYDTYKSRNELDGQTGHLLTVLYLRQKRPGKAEEIVQDLRSKGYGNSPMLNLLKAKIELNYGDFARAASSLKEVLRVDPANAEALSLLPVTQVLVSGGSSLPSNLTLTRQTVPLFLREADRRWVEGETASATMLMENLHARDPRNLQIAQRLARYYALSRQTEKTRELMREVSKHHPDNKKLQDELSLLEETDPQKRYEGRMARADELEDPISRATEKAQIAAAHDKPEESTKFLTQAAELSLENPDQPDSRAAGVIARLLTVLQGEEKWDAAEKWIERAAEADLDQAEGQVFRAQMAMSRKDYAKAVEILEALLKNRDYSKQIWTLLGEAHLRQQHWSDAKEAFDTALSNDPAYVPAVIGMMKVTRVQDPESYPRWVTQAYRVAPQNTEVRSAYLNLQEVRTSDPRELIAKREQLFRSDPSNVGNAVRLASLYERANELERAESMYKVLFKKLKPKVAGASLLGRFYVRHGRADEMKRVVEDLRNSDESDPIEADLLYAELIYPQDLATAEAAVKKAIEQDSKDPRSYRLLARMYGTAGRPKEAAAAMEDFLGLGKGTLADEKVFIRFLIDAGDEKRALQRIDNILADQPNDPQALTLKGVILAKEGKKTEAIELLTRAIESNSQYAEPRSYRAMVYETQGRLPEAVSDLREAYRLTGSRSTALSLARLLIRRADYARAQELYKRLLDENPNDPAALDGLTRLYLEQKSWLALEQLISQRKSAAPKSVAPYIAEAQMWDMRDDQGKRIAALQKAVEINPNAGTVGTLLRAMVE